MKKRGDLWIVLIGVLKLVKAGLLIAAGVGALKLVHRDVKATLEGWIQVLRVDPQSRFLHNLLAEAAGVDPRKLQALGIGSFLYGAVFLVEGVGLVLKKRWAEYMTLAVTLSFIPFEVYEVARRASWIKVLAIVVNVAVVAYLWFRIRRDRQEERGRPEE